MIRTHSVQWNNLWQTALKCVCKHIFALMLSPVMMDWTRFCTDNALQCCTSPLQQTWVLNQLNAVPPFLRKMAAWQEKHTLRCKDIAVIGEHRDSPCQGDSGPFHLKKKDCSVKSQCCIFNSRCQVFTLALHLLQFINFAVQPPKGPDSLKGYYVDFNIIEGQTDILQLV